MMTITLAAPLIACRIIEEMKREFSETYGVSLPANLEEASERTDINMYGADYAARLLGTHVDDVETTGSYLEAAQAIVDAFLRYRSQFYGWSLDGQG